MAEQKTDAQKAEERARTEEQKAQEARAKAEHQDQTPAEKKAEDAAAKADDARAEAEQAKAEQGSGDAATTAAEAKVLSAVAEPDRAVGDHHAQKFSNTPENPQLAPGLDPEAEGEVKLVMETSDTLAAGKPNVCYVHPEMVGDYLRAGWSRG